MVRVYDPCMMGLVGQVGEEDCDFEAGSFNAPMGVCVDDAQALLVCDLWTHRVQTFTVYCCIVCDFDEISEFSIEINNCCIAVLLYCCIGVLCIVVLILTRNPNFQLK